MQKFLLFLFVILFVVMTTEAQIPQQMTYQGYLTDNSANPITSNLQLTFTIYDAQSGGTNLWSEVHPSVAIVGGVFRVQLGSVTPLDLPFDAPYWLGIKVASDPEMVPRVALSTVGYSFSSIKADSVENLANNSVTTTTIQDGAVTQAKLAPGVSLPPGGTAGGDLTGTYPNPSIASGAVTLNKISSAGASAGQAITYNGTSIVWQEPAGGIGGSGTTGYLPKFTGSATLGNSIINESGGRIGIGITSSSAKLQINGSGESYGLNVVGGSSYAVRGEWSGSSGGSALLGSNSGTGGDAVQAYANGSGRSALFAYSTGTVDYSIYSLGSKSYFQGKIGVGTTDPGTNQLQVNQTVTTNYRAIQATTSSSGVGAIQADNDGTGMAIYCYVNSTSYPSLRANNANASGAILEGYNSASRKFAVLANGNVLADGTYSGPADFSEMIAVSSGATSVEPGDVLVIDPATNRATQKSTTARSTLVAGIYSTRPGFVGSERDWDKPAPVKTTVDGSEDGIVVQNAGIYTMEDMAAQFNEIPVAVVGIVPCKVSAENGAIRPGDLLVTSDTPGHAMRDDNPRVGTVVGKALEPFSSGTGVIKVLVTLH